MMNGWLMLDGVAVIRGDGLNPALREILATRAAIEGFPSYIVEIAKLRGELSSQAGPVPAPAITGALPENVVHFPGRASNMFNPLSHRRTD